MAALDAVGWDTKHIYLGLGDKIEGENTAPIGFSHYDDHTGDFEYEVTLEKPN